MAACTIDNPCGAMVVPDRAFNRDMELYGLPQRRYCCVAGHSVMVGLPAGLAEQVPDELERPRRLAPRPAAVPAIRPALPRAS